MKLDELIDGTLHNGYAKVTIEFSEIPQQNSGYRAIIFDKKGSPITYFNTLDILNLEKPDYIRQLIVKIKQHERGN